MTICLKGLTSVRSQNSLDDRDSVTLMDESFHLKNALSLVKKPEALKQLLSYLTTEGSRSFYFSDYKEIMSAIMETCVELYKTDTSIYDYVRDYFVKLEHLYNKEICKTHFTLLRANRYKMGFVPGYLVEHKH